MKKRYLLFSGSRFYPFGGMSDLRGDFSTQEEAHTTLQRDLAGDDPPSWAHIWDSQDDIIFDLFDLVKPKR